MGTVEKVIDALRKLPPEGQAEVLDFAEFLRARRAQPAQSEPQGLDGPDAGTPNDVDAPQPSDGGAFRRSSLEAPDAPSVYRGRPLTLAQMREAVDWEAGGAK